MVGGGFVNSTSRFLATHWATIRPHLLDVVRARFYHIRSSGIAEDALSDLTISLIKSDRLAPYLNSGEGIHLGVLTVWALQKAYSRLRSWGVDVHLRAAYGARSRTEPKDQSSPDPGTEDEILEVESNDLSQDDHVAALDVLGIIQRVAGQDMDPHILCLKADGAAREDIAAEMGMTKGQVARRLTDIRERTRIALSNQI